jgi:SAM-dependent methyltransferase
VLASSRQRILSELSDDARVIDIGGWGQPFPRADWVVDLMPYETRGLYGYEQDPARERFGPETWLKRDICAPEAFPFDDLAFDFAICSHTLEDVRDPIKVCGEMVRIAKRGYVEVPSRLVEQAWGVEGPWVGWGHHRWLIDVVEGRLRFVMKHQIVHHARKYRFPPGFEEGLTDDQRVISFWWQESFEAYEDVFTTDREADADLGGFIASNRHLVRSVGTRRWLGRQSWLSRRVLARLRHKSS